MSSSHTILCSSENLYELYAIVSRLKQAGYEVLMAGTHGRAVELAGSNSVDAIVISAVRSVADYEMAAALKAVCPKTPIVLLTREKLKPSDYPAGVDFVANKPSEKVADVLHELFQAMH